MTAVINPAMAAGSLYLLNERRKEQNKAAKREYDPDIPFGRLFKEECKREELRRNGTYRNQSNSER